MTARNIYFALATAVAVALLSSCGSRRATVAPDYGDASGLEVNTDAKTDFAALAQSYTLWESVTMPVRVSMTSPKSFSISGTMKMRQGESILVSMRMFGMEVASAYADNDSVLIYAKAMNLYYSAPVAELSEKYGITLANIQSILLGQVFVPGAPALNASDIKEFKFDKKENAAFSFYPKKTPADIGWSYSAIRIGDEAPVLVGMEITPAAGHPVLCTFTGHEATGAGMAAGNISVTTGINGKDVAVELTPTLSKARWNDTQAIKPPKISSKARRVNSDELYKMLKKL